MEPDQVSVRSTLRPDQIVRFSADEWDQLVAAVKAGEFDR